MIGLPILAGLDGQTGRHQGRRQRVDRGPGGEKKPGPLKPLSLLDRQIGRYATCNQVQWQGTVRYFRWQVPALAALAALKPEIRYGLCSPTAQVGSGHLRGAMHCTTIVLGLGIEFGQL